MAEIMNPTGSAPSLGFGLGLRTAHYPEIFEGAPRILREQILDEGIVVHARTSPSTNH